MKDAGDVSGRADSGSEPPRPAGQVPKVDGDTGGLSKRAARRRRKRRAGDAAAGIEGRSGGRADEEPIQEAVPASKPSVPAKRNKRRRRSKSAESGEPVRSLRGIRSAVPGRPGASGERSRNGGRSAERRSDGATSETRQRSSTPHRGLSGERPLTRSVGERALRRGGDVGSAGGPLYAALDLGTNNCRLLVAEPQERGFRVVDAFSRIVRLGEGIGRSGRLSEAAMDRAVEALAICRHKMEDLSVRRMRLVATEACRAAANGAQFLDRVRAETGLSLEIVDRETEARLAVAGCATLVDQRAEGVILFDIGGGSSELVWLDLRERGEARGFALTRFIRAWTSLPVGVVTLSERHGGVTVTPAVFDAMVEEVARMLESFEGVDEVAQLVTEGRVHMLGTSGTVTTLAGIHLGLKRYDRRRVDGVWLEAPDVDAMVGRLVSMSFEERVANPCIGADRADLVLAGCAILEAIRRRWPCRRLRVADRGLREGILVELMARDGVWRRRAQRGGRQDTR